MNKNFCIVTTINSPTKAIEVLYEKFGSNLIVVGDEKTPKDWNYKDAQYILDLPDEKGWYEGYAPRNSYARKNLGYLEAVRQGAELIYDTDDDNIPNGKWRIRTHNAFARLSFSHGWFNIYKLFHPDYNLWPRGFSLKNINSIGYWDLQNTFFGSSIQQGLSDNEPDVDSIYRLIFKKRQTIFERNISAYLQANSWCPFNSQSTWFFKKAFPLLYLPCYATFRMTDIWRSFVAQRCLWELNDGITFHSPSEVYQDRNEHDLLKDFEDEIPGYLHNDEIVDTLQALTLKQGEENICENMLICYQAIVDKNILPENEIRSLKLWIRDYEAIKANMERIG